MESIAEVMLQVLKDRLIELENKKSNAETVHDVTIAKIRLDELEYIIREMETAITNRDEFNTN